MDGDRQDTGQEGPAGGRPLAPRSDVASRSLVPPGIGDFRLKNFKAFWEEKRGGEQNPKRRNCLEFRSAGHMPTGATSWGENARQNVHTRTHAHTHALCTIRMWSFL